ncbi:MAG TPA: hypothetical protein VF794_35155 [Archangium sp.]|jgi:WD40 repeat protein|uniref:YncE family protein n=1 Tax=Archangium sp. TaxID=1872627 RepID=UPI002ED92BCB
MRPHFLSLALLLAACNETDPRPPPTNRFVYPSGLVHRVLPGSTNGVLYVASANFDRCFDQGTVMAVDLDQVSGIDGNLPALGTAPSGDPLRIDQLNIPDSSRVFIQSYAGEMALWNRPDGSARLFVPARADGDFLHYIDVTAPTALSCVGASGGSRDCVEGAVSLSTEVPGQVADLPRAPAPFGVDVTPEGRVWVTHVDPADTPARSGTGFVSYVVSLNGETPGLSTDSFVPLQTSEVVAVGGSHSVDATERYVFVSGRASNRVLNANNRRFLLRLLDTAEGRQGRVIDPGLDLAFAARDARGFALTPASTTRPRRLYLAVRSPDSLVVVDVQGLETDSPSLRLVDSVPLPDGPTQVTLVPRGPTRSELVVVSCSASGVVAIYDPDVGQVVSQITVGEVTGDRSPQPFGIAVQQTGNAARLFVSNFGDGRISVIDIPALESPQLARLVAYLGSRQDVEGVSTCQEVEQ